MNINNYEQIKNYLNDDTYLKSGKEVHAYKLNDEVIKIFHTDDNGIYERLSDEKLRFLATLKLKAFNQITGFITNDDGNIIGYKEKYLEDEEFNLENLYFSDEINKLINCLDDICDDIHTLSSAGFVIRDLNYNYFYKNGKITFTDMTSYTQYNTDVNYLKHKIYKDNLKTVNLFLIAFIIYNGYKKGDHNEYKLAYKSLQYHDSYCKNKFFGDVFKKMISVDDEYKNNKKV